MRHRFLKNMRLAEDRIHFYGLGGFCSCNIGMRPLNARLLRGGVQEWDEHTCNLTAEERMLRAIFDEQNPCCTVIHKSEYVPAPFVRAEIRKGK